MDSYINRFIN